VQVRHRYFTGRADFAKWCEELPYINEPVVFYISSHGNEQGITVGSEVLDGKFIGEQLRDASSVKLIHLGACLTMAGAAPQEIRKASKLAAPVSGYTKTADWAGSAVIDFAYMDLVLARHGDEIVAMRLRNHGAMHADRRFVHAHHLLLDHALGPAALLRIVDL
jgi:hypothetical protein